MSHNIAPGPIAPENNPPIHPEYYQPRSYIIESITLGIQTLITTVVDHDYEIGQTIRLLIPVQYGSRQLNDVQGVVISIPQPDQVLTTINSSMNVNNFIPTPPYGPILPQIIAIGDVNSGVINFGRSLNSTHMPAGFINVSPSPGNT